MSDHSVSLVPELSLCNDRKQKANEILKWLISIDAVKSEPSDCILSSEYGYSISEGASKITAEPEYLPFELVVNGLEIITERQVFHAGENGIETLICPNCREDIASEDWEFLNKWSSGESNNLTCPKCRVGAEIHNFKFIPAWGFSDLGFTFWNWPAFTDTFIEGFKRQVGCDIEVVYAKI